MPETLSTGVIGIDESPFENVVVTWPLGTGLPQLSVSRIFRGTESVANWEKLLTRPICVGISVFGVHDEVARGDSPNTNVPVVPVTMNVTLTDRTAAVENE